MLTRNRKLSALALSLVLLMAAAMPAGAQYRDRDLSTKKKIAYIAGGAAAGALIGGLLKGKNGALVGGLLGAGAGTGYVYIRGRNDRDRYRYYGRRSYYDDRDYSRYDRDYYSRDRGCRR